MAADITTSAPITVRRMPNWFITAAANGPARPYRKMPTAAENEIASMLQPKAVCSGRISTPGVARRPAAVSSATKMTATTTKAYFWPKGRVAERLETEACCMLLTST